MHHFKGRNTAEQILLQGRKITPFLLNPILLLPYLLAMCFKFICVWGGAVAWLYFPVLSTVFIHSPNNRIVRRTFSLILLPTVSLVCLSTFLTHSPNLLYQFYPQQEEQEEDLHGIFRAICYCGSEESVTLSTDCQFVLWQDTWEWDKWRILPLLSKTLMSFHRIELKMESAQWKFRDTWARLSYPHRLYSQRQIINGCTELYTLDNIAAW